MRVHKVSRVPGVLARFRRDLRELALEWELHCRCCDDSHLWEAERQARQRRWHGLRRRW